MVAPLGFLASQRIARANAPGAMPLAPAPAASNPALGFANNPLLNMALSILATQGRPNSPQGLGAVAQGALQGLNLTAQNQFQQQKALDAAAERRRKADELEIKQNQLALDQAKFDRGEAPSATFRDAQEMVSKGFYPDVNSAYMALKALGRSQTTVAPKFDIRTTKGLEAIELEHLVEEVSNIKTGYREEAQAATPQIQMAEGILSNIDEFGKGGIAGGWILTAQKIADQLGGLSETGKAQLEAGENLAQLGSEWTLDKASALSPVSDNEREYLERVGSGVFRNPESMREFANYMKAKAEWVKNRHRALRGVGTKGFWEAHDAFEADNPLPVLGGSPEVINLGEY